MNFKYQLSDCWINKVRAMEGFANGATQVTVLLKGGREFREVLVSDATFVIAVRGFEDLPFELSEIDDITQGALDKSPLKRGGWRYWDDWGGRGKGIAKLKLGRLDLMHPQQVTESP